MQKLFEIKRYEEKFREQLLLVWEKSVLATHDFLSPEDFISIKELVHTIDFNAFDVYCLTCENNVVGFLGVAERKAEMLFIDPDYLGQGLGKKLMDFAFTTLNVINVDVNEQNSNAVKFYKKLGFETYERTEKDDQGKNYPLLRMKMVTIKTQFDN
jgi:putative acetyltransferase